MYWTYIYIYTRYIYIYIIYVYTRLYNMYINDINTLRRRRGGTSHIRIWRYVACATRRGWWLLLVVAVIVIAAVIESPSAGRLSPLTRRTHAGTHATRHRVFPQERARERFRPSVVSDTTYMYACVRTPRWRRTFARSRVPNTPLHGSAICSTVRINRTWRVGSEDQF